MDRFWENKKIVVTGHEGFLGASLTRFLVESGAKVVGIDLVLNRKHSRLEGVRNRYKGIKGNIANLKLVRETITKHKPQFIFHLAAQAIVDKANKNPVEAFKSNMEGTWNLLDVSRDQDFIEAIVVASSDKAYGDHKNLPYHEDFALQGRHPYDVSKSCTDLLCQTYQHTYDVPVAITRCGNIYGPGEYHFSRIVPDAVCSTLKGKQLIIRSNGKFTRDYIYVDDVLEAYLLLAKEMKRLKLEGEAFNFSTENPISVLDLVNKIRKMIPGECPPPKILGGAEFEIKHQYLSAQKARKILKWKPKYNLEKGLEKTIIWYRNHG